ncbi:MAG: hypothetical protein EOP37_21630 [Rubrivivax sp.]|nr:MAG: hypothetical protein EOP37_21630 [Rubrivivax sp.]
MNAVCLFDLEKGSAPLTVTVVAEEKLPKELKTEIEGILRNTATLVSSQGLSPGRDDAVLQILSLSFSADGRTAVAALAATTVPAVAWRVLVGLLSAFDTTAATIDDVRIEQQGYTGKPYSEAELFAVAYPGTDAMPGFALTNAHDCPKVKRSGNRLLVARMDMWDGDEGAFRAVINQMAHFQRLHGCIESVSVE